MDMDVDVRGWDFILLSIFYNHYKSWSIFSHFFCKLNTSFISLSILFLALYISPNFSA